MMGDGDHQKGDDDYGHGEAWCRYRPFKLSNIANYWLKFCYFSIFRSNNLVPKRSVNKI